MSSIIDFLRNIKTTVLSIGINDILEILIMTYLIYILFKWMKNTRSWFVIRGIIVILIFFLLAEILKLNTILYLARNSFDIIIIALVIVFRPELRRGIENLGKKNPILRIFSSDAANSLNEFSEDSADALVEACFALSETKTGALVVIEREDPLEDYIKTGIKVDAAISPQLLINIFEHNTPLHDGAIIVRGNRIVSATCYLPLSQNTSLSKSFGTRHRAALGVSEQTDSITLVVSEETGHVSIAMKGRLLEDVSRDKLQTILRDLAEEAVEKADKKLLSWKRGQKK